MFLKRLIYITILVISISCILKTWHSVTGGFRGDKIQPSIDVGSALYERPYEFDESLLKIFDQQFSYLDKGCQVYVFGSEDNNYVLKIIRYEKYKPYFWMNFTSFVKQINDCRKDYVKVRKQRLTNNYKSYLMSYDELKDLTEVVYVHIGHTDHINKTVVIKSRFGQKTYVDLDKTHFIVQRKGIKLTTELIKSYKQKKYSRVRFLIDDYFTVLQKRCLKQIRNGDGSGFIRNMSLYNDKVIEIDVGGYHKLVDFDENIFEYEFMRFAKRLKKWSKTKIPLFEQYIEKQTTEKLDESILKMNNLK